MTRGLTNPWTGPLLDLEAVPLRAHDPAVAIWGGRAVPRDPDGEPLVVGGAGWCADDARGASEGEALERWEARPAPSDRLVRAAFAAWPRPEEAIAPEAWVGFHPAQLAAPGFPFAPFTATTEVDWVRFRRLPDGAPVYVPADQAYMSPGPGGHHQVAPGISTGLVAGPSAAPLVRRGLQEVLERDAVVGAWWGAYPLEELEQDAVFASLGEGAARRLRRPNLLWRFFRVASPWTVHVTMATLEGEDLEGPCFSIGSACRASRGASLEKAALEAVQGRHYARYLRGQRRAPLAPPLTDFPDHAVFYSLHPERLAETPLARAAPAAEPLGAEAGRLEDLAGLVAELGPAHPVLFRDMTPRALACLWPGWAALRVLVPGMQPLYGDDRLAPLGGPLWGARDPGDLARLPPHPFP